ncbi:hypothetical protein Ancab_011319 [Ancistrocladus abbreviatus]
MLSHHSASPPVAAAYQSCSSLVASMDIVSPIPERVGPLARASQWLIAIPKRLTASIMDFLTMAIRLGKDDPRRVVHAFKVALAISIVSLFYYFQPLYNGFGTSTMWAVLTVVVVFEFSEQHLEKVFNRMIATLLAGFLGVLAHHLSDLTGKIGEPVLQAIFGFVVATIVTFMRFFPRLKARYDYGLMIFILTFFLVSVSSYEAKSGAELHNLIASNIDKLSCYLDGFGREYFSVSEEEKARHDKSVLHLYKSVLGSKGTEENMASPEIKQKIQNACNKLTSQSSKALKELSLEMKKMRRSSSVNAHIEQSKSAAQELKSLLETVAVWEDFNLLAILPVATVASSLIEVVACIEDIAEVVHELATLADFMTSDRVVAPETPEVVVQEAVMTGKPLPEVNGSHDQHDHVVVTISGGSS